MVDLENKRALITGASRGMGAAIAERLASEGARVFLTARDERLLEKLISDLSAIGADVDFAPADLRDDLQLERVFARGIEFLGGIDVLVNNAGIGIKGNVASMDVADWDRMFAINLRAAFLLSRLATGEMMRQKSGYIINIGSGASQTPIAGYAGYCASKYGLLGFSESLGLELREHNIKVSIILPGSTATYFGGSSPDDKIMSKPGILRPKDVADSVLYLLKQSDIAWTSVMNLRPLNLKRAQ
jgi:3-oxoacyl-[acyl-carrier protein] reductase